MGQSRFFRWATLLSFVLLACLYATGVVEAACTTSFMTAGGNTTRPRYFRCALESELPSSGLTVGDLGSAADTDRVYVADSTTTWVQHAPRTTGTFTITGTGFTSNPTGTARWEKIGTVVSLFIPTLSATSNAASFTLTGLPSEIVPVRSDYFAVLIQDNGVNDIGYAGFTGASSTVTMFRTAAGSSSWTTSGTKAILNIHLQYNLQ